MVCNFFYGAILHMPAQVKTVRQLCGHIWCRTEHHIKCVCVLSQLPNSILSSLCRMKPIVWHHEQQASFTLSVQVHDHIKHRSERERGFVRGLWGSGIISRGGWTGLSLRTTLCLLVDTSSIPLWDHHQRPSEVLPLLINFILKQLDLQSHPWTLMESYDVYGHRKVSAFSNIVWFKTLSITLKKCITIWALFCNA